MYTLSLVAPQTAPIQDAGRRGQGQAGKPQKNFMAVILRGGGINAVKLDGRGVKALMALSLRKITFCGFPTALL